MNSSGVVGVLCADKQGMCLTGKKNTLINIIIIPHSFLLYDLIKHKVLPIQTIPDH